MRRTCTIGSSQPRQANGAGRSCLRPTNRRRPVSAAPVWQRIGARRGAAASSFPAILAADQSAAVRASLLEELRGLTSADRAADWAREALPSKNRLTPADAKAWRRPSSASGRVDPSRSGRRAVCSGGATRHRSPGAGTTARRTSSYSNARRYRQERVAAWRATALSQPRASAVCRQPGLLGLRAPAL